MKLTSRNPNARFGQYEKLIFWEYARPIEVVQQEIEVNYNELKEFRKKHDELFKKVKAHVDEFDKFLEQNKEKRIKLKCELDMIGIALDHDKQHDKDMEKLRETNK